MITLGIETSCDDTSLSLFVDDKHSKSVSFSQADIFNKWGGVIPEIAARNHLDKLELLLPELLVDVSAKDIDLIGVTTHPGLLGPLITGVNLAKTLALFLKKEIVPVNHIYAHILAITMTKEIKYPFIGLVVSGGHTHFFKVNDSFTFTFLGGTLDDAAGEALDKGAKLLGLGYPGGHIIDKLASSGKHLYDFPISKIEGLNFSFSGIKSALVRFLQKNKDFKIEDVAASYQYGVINALKEKIELARSIYKLPIVIGGGVAANSYLRTLEDVYFVDKSYCMDNGAMIANYAYLNRDRAINFPRCLSVDAGASFY